MPTSGESANKTKTTDIYGYPAAVGLMATGIVIVLLLRMYDAKHLRKLRQAFRPAAQVVGDEDAYGDSAMAGRGADDLKTDGEEQIHVERVRSD